MPKPDLSDLERHWNCRLTVRGRKTGEPRSVTIWYALGDGIVYLTGSKGEPQWCRNIRACGDVELQIGSRTLKGRARVIDDEAEAESIRQRFIDRYWLARLSRPFGGYTVSVPVVIEIED